MWRGLPFAALDLLLPQDYSEKIALFGQFYNGEASFSMHDAGKFVDPDKDHRFLHSLCRVRAATIYSICYFLVCSFNLWFLRILSREFTTTLIQALISLFYLINLQMEIIEYRRLSVILLVSLNFFTALSTGILPDTEDVLPRFFLVFDTLMPIVPLLSVYVVGGYWGLLLVLWSTSVVIFSFWNSLGRTYQITFSVENLYYLIFALTHQLVPMLVFKVFDSETGMYHDLLARSFRASEEGNKAKNVFISRMSHELRTPLHGILASSTMLKASPLTEQQLALLSMVESCGELLLDIVVKILDISRIQAGRFEKEVNRMSLFELAQHVADSFVGISDRKGIDLLIAFDLKGSPQGYDVIGDHVHLSQILVNLFGNGVKFTSNGSISMNIRAVDSTDEGFSIFRIEIQDTGEGIPLELGPQLFEPFIQAVNNLKKKPEGAGLGLSIAKQYTEALGGRIGFDAENQKGSCFWIELPMERLPAGTIYPSLTSLPLANMPEPFRIGLISRKEESLKNLASYLADWSLPFEEILEKENAPLLFQDAALTQFSHFIVDNDYPQLLFLLHLLHKSSFPQLSRSTSEQSLKPPEEIQEAERPWRAPLSATPPNVSPPFILFLCFFSQYSQAKKNIQATGLSSQILILTKPFGPVKLAKALLSILAPAKVAQLNPRESPLPTRFSLQKARPVIATTLPSDPLETAFTFAAENSEEANFTEGLLFLPEGSSPHFLNPPTSIDLEEPATSVSSAGARQDNQANVLSDVQVLVVEDNHICQMVIQKQLEHLQVPFKITPSAEEGIRIWKEALKPIPLLFMDIEVEGSLNGLQATALIRGFEQESERKPATFVAIMTGRALEEDKREAFAAGCDEFLVKPINPNKIRELVQKWTSNPLKLEE